MVDLLLSVVGNLPTTDSYLLKHLTTCGRRRAAKRCVRHFFLLRFLEHPLPPHSGNFSSQYALVQLPRPRESTISESGRKCICRLFICRGTRTGADDEEVSSLRYHCAHLLQFNVTVKLGGSQSHRDRYVECAQNAEGAHMRRR